MKFHDVVKQSLHAHDVKKTSIQRLFNVMCRLIRILAQHYLCDLTDRTTYFIRPKDVPCPLLTRCPKTLLDSPFHKLRHQQYLPRFDFIVMMIDSQMTSEITA